MSKKGSADVGPFQIGGYDILGTLTSITDKIEAVTEETHTLGDSWVENEYVGLRRWSLTQNGYYDNAAHSANDALSANFATAKVIVYGVEGNATGARFVGSSGALQVNYETVLARGELHKANAEYQCVGLIEEGRIIRPLAGATATGFGVANAVSASGQSYDFGASNVSGGAGYLAISSLVGATATGLVVDIMHSADNLTFTSYIGFAAVSATTPSAQRVASTAAVQRYVAERHTGGTGFPTSAIFFVGFAPK